MEKYLGHYFVPIRTIFQSFEQHYEANFGLFFTIIANFIVNLLAI